MLRFLSICKPVNPVGIKTLTVLGYLQAQQWGQCEVTCQPRQNSTLKPKIQPGKFTFKMFNSCKDLVICKHTNIIC